MALINTTCSNVFAVFSKKLVTSSKKTGAKLKCSCKQQQFSSRVLYMTSFAVYIGDEIGNTAISKLGDSKLCAPRHAHKSKQIVKGQQFVDLGPRKALGEITNRAYPQVSSKPGQAHIGAPGRGEKLTCTTHLPSCSKPVHMDKHAQNNPTPKLTVPTITPISASICAIEKKEVDTVEITSHEDIEQMHLYDFPAHQRCQQEFGIEVSRIIMPFSHVPAVITTGSKDDSVNTEVQLPATRDLSLEFDIPEIPEPEELILPDFE